MKLYGHPMSTCTRKVLTIMAEKGIEPELVTVEVFQGENKQPEHMARQPFGQIPAIDDDGFKLYESRAIVRYLDEKLGGPSFTPKDAKDRALMEQWISIEMSHFTPAAMKIIYQRVINKMMGKPSDEAIVTAARADLEKTVAIMEEQLGKTPFLAGSQPSIADICYLPYIEYLFAGEAGDIITSSPNVAKWWTSMSNRPAWKKAAGKN